MNPDHQLLQKIVRHHRLRTWFIPWLAPTLVLSAFALPFQLIRSSLPPELQLQIIALALLCSALAFSIVRRKTRQSLRQTACAVDQILTTQNQLEMMVELGPSDHPLKQSQEQLCEEEYGTYAPPLLWRLSAPLLPLLLVLSLLVFMADFIPCAKATPPEIAVQTSEEPAPPEEEFAELQLIHPKEEIRRKPLDEVVWQGAGRSTHGFDALQLCIQRNGEPAVELPLSLGLTNRPGSLEFEGVFFLDELEAEPFDLFSYHLEGRSEIDGVTNQVVLSLPQFIEIRPFREDAKTSNCSGDPKILNFIKRTLRFQIALNKATYAIQTSGLASTNPVIREQIALLEQDQQHLCDSLSEFLRQIDLKTLEPEIIGALFSAEQSMQDAGEQLQKLQSGEVL